MVYHMNDDVMTNSQWCFLVVSGDVCQFHMCKFHSECVLSYVDKMTWDQVA